MTWKLFILYLWVTLVNSLIQLTPQLDSMIAEVSSLIYSAVWTTHVIAEIVQHYLPKR
jgi:hypothetical protein